jgi:hypothetical protein
MKKNIIYISIGIFLAAGTVSCKKYLDTKPQDVIVPNQYYSSESEVNAAIAGIYSSLAQDGTFSRNIPIELDMANDEAQYNNRNNNTLVPALYDCQSSTKIYSDCWSALYRGINASNMLLEAIKTSPVADNIKNVAIGEATFIRGFNYFQLVSRYGDVPLILKATTEVSNPNYVRTPSLQVYKQILEDMKAAEPLVKDITAVGNGSHITKTAIQGIIARVYLKMAGRPLSLGAPMYDSARVWAKKVVTSNIHSLNTNYRQVFINHSKDLYDYRESMFEIEFYGNNTPTGTLPPGSRFACQLAMRYTGGDVNPLIVYGYGSYIPTGTLYDIYQKIPNDTLRRNWNIPTYTYSSNTTPRSTTTAAASPWDRDCGKWKRDEETYIPKSRDWGPTNFPILRYADVLLMLSEAEMELGNLVDARLYLNQVRTRAQANLVTDLMSPDQATLRGIIHDERARELCFEGLRKFDLVRWGEFYSAMVNVRAAINASTSVNKARYLVAYNNVTLRDTLLPIPTSEISVNNLMTQNAGW